MSHLTSTTFKGISEIWITALHLQMSAALSYHLCPIVEMSGFWHIFQIVVKLLSNHEMYIFIIVRVQGNISHLRCCWQVVPFPHIHPCPPAYGPSPMAPPTSLINSQQASLPSRLPSLPMEEDISTNVSVVRTLGGPCGGWWFAIDCYSLFRGKEPPCLAFLSISSPHPPPSHWP